MKKKWEEQEIKFLEKNYVEKGVDYCVGGLNRTKDSIKKKAISIGLNLKTRRYQFLEFSKIILESRSYSDATRKLGLDDGHGNRTTVKKYIKIFNLDITHFDYKGNNIRENIVKLSLDKILTTNSTYCRNNLKARLYKEGLKQRCCEMCGQGEEWNGNKMSLILDHENGVHDDNRIENLRIVCPNCNATLDTHGGKNRSKKIIKK